MAKGKPQIASQNFSGDKQEVGLGVFPTIKRKRWKRRSKTATKEAYNRTRRVGVGGRHPVATFSSS